MATKISNGELKQEGLLQDAMKFASVMPGLFGAAGNGMGGSGNGGSSSKNQPDMSSMMKMMSAMMSNKEGMEAFSNMMNPKGKQKDTRATINKNALKKSVTVNRLKSKLEKRSKETE
jgi:enhancing lycopene biosynthesis protein 2